MQRISVGLFIALAIVAVPFVIYIQVGVWNECRVDHSFFYCMNLVNGR